MELRISMGYEQVLHLVQQLPWHEKQQLAQDIEHALREEEQPGTEPDDVTEFQELLLHGPVMSDEQFENFQNLRKAFKTWIRN